MKDRSKVEVHKLPRTITFSPEQLEELNSLVRDAFLDEGDDEQRSRRLYILREILSPGITMEIYRSVSDFKGDFDRCREQAWSKTEVLRAIRVELDEAGVKNVGPKARRFTWDEPEFLEFDSPRDHASGYWLLRMYGPAELEKALTDYWESQASS